MTMENLGPEEGQGGPEPKHAPVMPMQASGEFSDDISRQSLSAMRLGRVTRVANQVLSLATYFTERNKQLVRRNYEKSAQNVRERLHMYEFATDYQDPVKTAFHALKRIGRLDGRVRYLEIGPADGKTMSELVTDFDFRDAELTGLEYSAPQFENSMYWWPLYNKRGSKTKGEQYIHISDAGNDQLQQLARATFIEGSATDIPLTSNSVDIVSALYMLYDLDDQERPRAYEQIERVLRSGGIFIDSTSGQGNKPQHRKLEADGAELMSEALGIKISPPRRMNARHTTEKAKKELKQWFKDGHVYLFEFQGDFVIDTTEKCDIFEKSLLSMHDQNDPVPPEDVYKKTVDKLLENIRSRIGTDDPFVEKVSRAVFICSKDVLDLGDDFAEIFDEDIAD